MAFEKRAGHAFRPQPRATDDGVRTAQSAVEIARYHAERSRPLYETWAVACAGIAGLWLLVVIIIELETSESMATAVAWLLALSAAFSLVAVTLATGYFVVRRAVKHAEDRRRARVDMLMEVVAETEAEVGPLLRLAHELDRLGEPGLAEAVREGVDRREQEP